MKNEREGKTEQGSVYSIYDQYYGLHIWSSFFYSGCKGIYIEEFFQPSQLRNLMVGGLQGEEWKFIQKYLKKNIQKCRWQISGSIKDHFAGENGVCEISQTLKKGCEITSQQKVFSQGCEVGFHLEVPSFPFAVYVGHLQEEIHPTVQKGCEIISQQKGDSATLLQNAFFSLE